MIRRAPRTPISFTEKTARAELIGETGAAPSYCYGYRFGDGALVPAAAAAGNRLNNVSALGFYRADAHPAFGCTLLLYSTGASVVWSTSDGFCFSPPALPAGKPFSAEAYTAEGSHALAVVCGNSMRVTTDSSDVGSVAQLPYTLYGGAVHCGRLFAADASDGLTVRWSGLRITDWDEGLEGSGHISLTGEAGKILALENFGDDVLCVRERGFTVIRALADSRNFRIAPSQCAVISSGGINSGGTVGGKYFFSKADGLYSYDGEEVAAEYPARGALSGFGRAYVTGDGYVYAECVYGGSDCLARYDPQTGRAVFFGKDCESPFAADGAFVCVKGNTFRKISEDYADADRQCRWDIAGADIAAGGLQGGKTLKYVAAYGSGDITVTVSAGGETRKFCGFGVIPVGMRGDCFTVSVSGECKVTRLYAEFGVVK